MQERTSGRIPPEERNARGHLSDVEVQRYIENDLGSDEIFAIQHHLNGCSYCFDVVASVHNESLRLEDQSETARLVSGHELNIDSQLQRLIGEGLVKPTAQKQISPSPFLLYVLGALRAARNHTRPYFIFAGSVAAVTLLTIFVGVPQYFAWRSDSLVEKSLATLIANYPVSDRNIPRPSGGFNYPRFGRERGLKQDKTDKTVADLQRALELNENNAKALQYLGTYFLIEQRDFQKARDAYAAVFAKDSVNASILSDMGVLAWYEGKFDSAITKFELALQYDPGFVEAQYNLAILLQKLEQKQAAIDAWEKYLEIDNESTWADIAKTYLKSLRQN